MEGDELIKRLQTISRVLNWIMGFFEDNPGRITDTEMLKFVDGMDYIHFTAK